MSVVAVAGRRKVSAASADDLRRRLSHALRRTSAKTLISSGAAGVDLLSQEVARSMGLRAIVVLPFEPPVFKRTSVVDQSSTWGEMFDVICRAAMASGDLEVIGLDPGDSQAYIKTNMAILDRAQTIGLKQLQDVVIIGVCDKHKVEMDYTERFLTEAKRRGLRTIRIHPSSGQD